MAWLQQPVSWTLFQFLLVQLKAVSCTRYPVSRQFQFLLVQLKAKSCWKYSAYISLFQFLLVQLKVQKKEFRLLKDFISIPTGSIKRSQSNNNLILIFISIPTGSIKRNLEGLKINMVIIFQFLLVQLKVLSGKQLFPEDHISIPTVSIKSQPMELSWFCYWISIPTGSIKSDDKGNNSNVGIEFQFLLVQLKA